MTRNEFNDAWQELQEPIQKVLQKTDHSAVVTTLMRFAAHIHMEAMHSAGHSQEQAREMFQGLASTCFDQQVRDGSWPNN
jgi:hypothetical protein